MTAEAYPPQLDGFEKQDDPLQLHPPEQYQDFPPMHTYAPLTEGAKFDAEKVRMDLLAPEGLEGTARVLTFGAQKYADRNWEKGINYSRVYGAALRHLIAWFGGANTDDETGLSHLHHAACCIHFLQTYEAREMHEFDDRPTSATTNL